MFAGRTSKGWAGSRQAGGVLLGLLVVLCLYAEELVHYKHSLYGFHEYYIVRNLGDIRGCSYRHGNSRELICSLPGYNSVLLGCLDNQCTYMDQDAPEITPKVLEAYRERNYAEYGRMPVPLKTWDQVPKNDKKR